MNHALAIGLTLAVSSLAACSSNGASDSPSAAGIVSSSSIGGAASSSSSAPSSSSSSSSRGSSSGGASSSITSSGASASSGAVSATAVTSSSSSISSSSASGSSASGGGASPASSATSASASSVTSSSTGSAGDAGSDAQDSGTGSIVTVSGYELLVQARSTDGTLGAAAPWDMKGVAWSPYGVNEPSDGSGKIYSTHGAVDIPLMSAAHINTVRTYGPLEPNAAGLAVLDTLHAHGMMVAMTVFAGYDDAAYTQAVNAFKDHPAVLLWIVGNEWNYNMLYSTHTLTECAQKVNAVATAIKALDPDHPVAIGYGEIPTASALGSVPAADLWALNIYPNLDFATRFTTWKSLTTKPFFVSEYGADAFNNKTMMEDDASQSTALDSLTTEIRGNLSAKAKTNVCIGGCPFEWNDEWWKSGDPAAHDNAGFANGGVYSDGFANEEWWGIMTATRTPRTAYTTLQTLYQ